MDELEQLEQTIFHEIKRTEKSMQDTNVREDTDRAMPRIDALNWVLYVETLQVIDSIDGIHFTIEIIRHQFLFRPYHGYVCRELLPTTGEEGGDFLVIRPLFVDE